MIEIKNLGKTYNGEKFILKNVNATINNKDVIGIIGPSGSGKSTFLRCLNLMNPATEGSILFNGKEINQKGVSKEQLRQKIGMVFQDVCLFEHMTAIENIMAGPVKILHKSKTEAYRKGMELLAKVGLEKKALSYPNSMSGGQKQRIAIARALAMEPEVLLLDEPTASLDPTMVREVEEIIKKLSQSGMTLLLVTHSLSLARNICNRIFYMDKATIYEEGPTEQIFTNPARERTKSFINNLKVFTLDINEHSSAAEISEKLQNVKQNNEMTEENARKFESHVWKMINQALPKVSDGSERMKILAQFNRNNNEIAMILYSSCSLFDNSQMKDIKEEQIKDDKYNFKYTMNVN